MEFWQLFVLSPFFVVKHEEKQENIRNSGEVVLEVDVDSVESISWENESESLAFHKEDGWIYDDDTAFPVNEEKINELSNNLNSSVLHLSSKK